MSIDVFSCDADGPDRIDASAQFRRIQPAKRAAAAENGHGCADSVQPPADVIALAAHSDRVSEALPCARLQALRLRIRSGAYEAPQVIDEIARRILMCGDISRHDEIGN